jgi:hypothetical protein
MVITSKKASLGWGFGGLVVSLCAIAQMGCSDNNSTQAGGDASTDGVAEDGGGPPPPLGVPVASCAGCPVCGGVLGGPTTGITYCTQTCKASADCPTGTACVANTTSSMILDMNCLKTCTGDSDCKSPFICRSDLPTSGKYCWSPYPAPGAGGQDAAVADAGAAETGSPADSGAQPDSGAPADSGTPADSGALPDAAPADAGDGG